MVLRQPQKPHNVGVPELVEGQKEICMTDEQKNELFTDVYELLDIYKEYSPLHEDGTNTIENVKPAILNMIDYIMKRVGNESRFS